MWYHWRKEMSSFILVIFFYQNLQWFDQIETSTACWRWAFRALNSFGIHRSWRSSNVVVRLLDCTLLWLPAIPPSLDTDPIQRGQFDVSVRKNRFLIFFSSDKEIWIRLKYQPLTVSLYAHLSPFVELQGKSTMWFSVFISGVKRFGSFRNWSSVASSGRISLTFSFFARPKHKSGWKTIWWFFWYENPWL